MGEKARAYLWRVSRRGFLQALLAMLLAACGFRGAAPEQGAGGEAPPGSAGAPGQGAATGALPPTPACGDEATPSQSAGPFFTPNSPQRASLLETGVTGTRLVITGYVLTRGCKPVGRALLEFWQADDRGVYDNSGYKLRGHQFTDENGIYRLETIVPGQYPGRTPHIHVRVQAANRPLLTTQLYFPGEPANQRDAIYRRELEMRVRSAAEGKAAEFNFVLEIP